MTPFWKVSSGNFAGWRRGDYVFNSNGDCVGYFRGELIYSLNGDYIGEIYRDDWVGKNTTRLAPIGSPRAGHVGIAVAPHADRVGLAVAGWDDPDF